MARLTHLSLSEGEGEEERIPVRLHGARNIVSQSSSPSASFSSDKENRNSIGAPRRDKGKGRATMQSPSTLSPDPEGRNPKKRRREVQSRVEADQMDSDQIDDELLSTQYYDPHQTIEDRRRLRKGLRDLTRDLNDSKTDFVQSGSKGLLDTIFKANEIMKEVRQTSEAVLDSRLLVETADLSYKKITNLNLGNATESVDVDEFVSKCISFMRNSSSPVPPTRRREGTLGHDSEDDDGDDVNWALFGHHAAFPRNSRPPVPGFLLGPLSVQRRARVPREKRATQRQTQTETVRPEELKASDLQKKDNNNLTALCTKIRDTLIIAVKEGEDAVGRESYEGISKDEANALIKRHNMTTDGGINFFRFAINPNSFGQSVENMFYISFLIRESGIAIAEDEDGLPTLHATEAHTKEEIREKGLQKYQAVFNLDYRTWRDLIDAFDIQHSMIPDRQNDESAVGARGWYG